MQIKIGHGFDAHKLLDLKEFSAAYPSRNTDGLYLGGVCIPYHKRLAGHSDADVLVHAIIDSLLGAAGLEDIGCQFPPSDKDYEAISSLDLLKRTLVLVASAGYKIGNIDATVVAEKPKLRAYISSMRAKLAETLKIELDQINIKATTTEGLGFTGREEGIAAHAVSLLIKNPSNV
jgi:2-C-methyl-D-erythritol 2,4-cyclodiphosphate synthase